MMEDVPTFKLQPGATLQLATLSQVHIDWLLANGVATEAIIKPVPIYLARGHRADDGILDDDPQGPAWFAFAEENDVILWRPKTGELATEWGAAFALGQDDIINPGVTALGQWLQIHSTPLDWLRANRRGIVVLRWEWAFEQLRDVTRIAVAESLLQTYRKHMKARLPEIAVIPGETWRAAA